MATALTACDGIAAETISNMFEVAKESTGTGISDTSNITTAVCTSATSSDTETDLTDLFSKRDLNQTPDLTDADIIEVADGKTYTISSEGIYIIRGTATNCTIRVEADKEAKVQLITLTNYYAVIDVALKTGYIEEDDIPTLNDWRKDPAHWGDDLK